MSDKSNKLNDSQMESVVGGITEDKALSIALKHANLKKEQIVLKKSKRDIDDGIAQYEIEFYANGKEYEYDINAATGSIMSFEFD